MSTSIQHYKQAEQVLADRHDLAKTYGSYEAVFAKAQVHATLALAAATALAALGGEGDDVTAEDWGEWNYAAGVTSVANRPASGAESSNA